MVKTVDMEAFHSEMKKQKDSSRKAAASDTGDWIEVNDGDEDLNLQAMINWNVRQRF